MRKQGNQSPEPARAGTVRCGSCGAVFSTELANCPYCGTMYLPAAEEAYMSRLEDVRSGLEALGEAPQKKMKTNLRALRRRLVIIAAFFLTVMLAWFVYHEVTQRIEAAGDRAEAVWQLVYFQQMDEAYAAGDYALLDELYTAAQDDGHHVWNYKHWRFCSFYQTLNRAEAALNAYTAGVTGEAELLYFELQICELEDLQTYLSPEEYSVLLALRAPLLEDLTQRFALTEAELSAFHSTIRANGFVSYAECESFLKNRGSKP